MAGRMPCVALCSVVTVSVPVSMLVHRMAGMIMVTFTKP